jgi:membrane peptidoglycan carboxypeptidase
VISSKTSELMTDILRGVVLPGGTGTLAAVPGYDVAGKTGTAQKIDPNTGRYSNTRTVASFVGFLPAHDPLLTILVVIDEPKTDQWGGTIAAPVFQRIAAQSVRHLGIAPWDVQGDALAMRPGIGSEPRADIKGLGVAVALPLARGLKSYSTRPIPGPAETGPFARGTDFFSPLHPPFTLTQPQTLSHPPAPRLPRQPLLPRDASFPRGLKSAKTDFYSPGVR